MCQMVKRGSFKPQLLSNIHTCKITQLSISGCWNMLKEALKSSALNMTLKSNSNKS